MQAKKAKLIPAHMAVHAGVALIFDMPHSGLMAKPYRREIAGSESKIAMDISPAILAGGLKVSLITPIYGALIFVISYLLWIILDYVASNKKNGS